MSKSGNSFFAFLFGLITGGVIGILFAPDKGINTRDRLSFQLDKIKKQMEDFLENLTSNKEIFANDAKDKGEQMVKDAKDKAEGLLDEVNGLIDQIKKD